ncbi:MAG: glycosyltransferase family 2 protein [Lachnospiraceae bacterium]
MSNNFRVKISIITPVYNCELYLKDCIQSVLNQTLQEWELLCIDDGSTDNSLAMLKQFAEKDSRIRVHSQHNQGAGIARNKGLELAKGEFIAFLDGDDFFLDTDALELMYQACELHGVDACGTNLRILRNNQIVEDQLFSKIAQEKEGSYEYNDYQFDYGYYCFIFRRSILEKNHLIFPDYRRFQDPVFFVRAMHKIQKFCFVNTALYCYRAPNMATRFDGKKLEDLLKGLLDNLQFAIEHNYNILLNQTVKRIEFEYGEMIYNNISETDISILKYLLLINEILQKKKGAEYVCLPLRKILGSVKENQKSLKEIFIHKLQEAKYIAVYGAGQAALDFLKFLKQKELFGKVDCILVTDEKNNPKQLEEIEVISIQQYIPREGELVVITASGIHYQDIEKLLKEKGVSAYCPLNIQIISK